MNEAMKQAWLEISDMLGEPTREELDVFLRTWQRASQATRKALAEQPAQQEPIECANGCRGFVKHSPPAQRTWVGLSDAELVEFSSAELGPYDLCLEVEAKLKEKNT